MVSDEEFFDDTPDDSENTARSGPIDSLEEAENVFYEWLKTHPMGNQAKIEAPLKQKTYFRYELWVDGEEQVKVYIRKKDSQMFVDSDETITLDDFYEKCWLEGDWSLIYGYASNSYIIWLDRVGTYMNRDETFLFNLYSESDGNDDNCGYVIQDNSYVYTLRYLGEGLFRGTCEENPDGYDFKLDSEAEVGYYGPSMEVLYYDGEIHSYVTRYD